MNIRKHIETLANGDSQAIFQEIKEEVARLDIFFEENDLILPSLLPQTKFAVENIGSYLRKAGQLSMSMETYARKIKFYETKPAIQRILKMEKDIKTCILPQEFGRLNRDLRNMKSQYAPDLSDLVSNRQQLLVSRLNMIQVWKSLVQCEIHVMEEGKKIVVQQIIKNLESVEDPSLRESVHNKLLSINMDGFNLEDTKIDTAAVRVANVEKLREVLVKQLDNVITMERTVIEKKTQFSELSRIFKDMKNQLPDVEIKDTPFIPAVSLATNEEPQKEAVKVATPVKHPGTVIQEKIRNI